MQLSCKYNEYYCNCDNVALKSVLKMKRLKNTMVKVGIQKLLSSSVCALSHTEVHQKIDIACDRATSYRVLEKLTNSGIVHKVLGADGVARYAYSALSDGHKHHVHFCCQQCKTTSCLTDIVPVVELPANFVVFHSSYVVSGICPYCAALKCSE